MSIYFYILLLLFRVIFLISKLPCLYVKRFELGMETALYKKKYYYYLLIAFIHNIFSYFNYTI